MSDLKTENSRLLRAMSAVAFDFECFFYADVVNNDTDGDLFMMRDSDMLTNLIPAWKSEKDFFNKVYLLVDYFVVPDERKKVLDLTRKQRIFEKLQNAPYTYVYAQCNDGAKTKTFFMKFCAVRDENQNLTGMILGLKDINEHVTKRNDEQIAKETLSQSITALTDDYEGIFLIDTQEDTIKTLKISDFYINFIQIERGDNAYSSRIDVANRTSINEADYDTVNKYFSLDYIKSELSEKQSYHVNYRLKQKFGRTFMCRAKFARFRSDSYDKVVLGIRFADREIIENNIYTKKLINRTEEAKKTIDYQLASLEEKNRELEIINLQIIDMLAAVAELRDQDTGKHIEKVKGYTRILAEAVSKMYPEYNLSDHDVQLISDASVLHDVGKIMVPDSVLLKPGRLTPSEFEVIKLHCKYGEKILKMAPANWSAEFIHYSKQICFSHHEKWDGRGYPLGLAGDDIPIAAQIVSIADCFDALSAERVYKKAFPPTTAFEMILAGECGVFNPKILECFKKVKDEFYRFERDTHAGTTKKTEDRNRLYTSKSLVVNDETLHTIKQLTEGMPLGFALFKRDGKASIEYCNDRLIKLFGCDTLEGLKAHTNNSLIEMIAPDDRIELRKQMNNKLLYNETLVYDVRCKKADGELFLVNIVAKKAYGTSSNDLYYAFFKDKTTNIKVAEIEEKVNDIYASHRKIEKISEAGNDGSAFQGVRIILINTASPDSEEYSSVKNTLEEDGAFVVQVSSSSSASALLARDSHFDILIVHQGDGKTDLLDLVKSIKIIQSESVKLPVLVISNEKSETLTQDFLNAGVSEVLDKPITSVKLAKAFISSMKSRSFEMETRLADTLKKATIDPLTRVKNSSAYADRTAYLDLAIKDKKAPDFAIVLCDINNLKGENDVFGHSVGDIYIKNCCKIICETFTNSSVYRIGGDEFVIILTDFELKYAEELLMNLERKVEIASNIDHSKNGKANFAFGIAYFDSENDYDTLSVMKRADKNMYKQKAKMKNK